MLLATCVLMAVLLVNLSSGENVAEGKTARQSTNMNLQYQAFQALNISYSYSGAITKPGTPAWWEVDLEGYYTIANIEVTAVRNAYQFNMADAEVHVMEEDISTVPNTPVFVCTTFPSTIANGEFFTFPCDAPFYVRYVRIQREGRLSVGHVEVFVTDCPRSCFITTKNTRLTNGLDTRTVSLQDCAKMCHEPATCHHFSFNSDVIHGDNCFISNQTTASTEPSQGWRLNSRVDCA